MLHLHFVNGKRGGLTIRKLDDHSGPQLDKRDREDQSSQSSWKHMRMTQRTVIIKSKRGEISKEYESTTTYYDLYEDLIREQFVHLDNSYVYFLDRSKFICPGFHFPLNEIIEDGEPLILTELERTEMIKELMRLEAFSEKEIIKNLIDVAKNNLNELYQLKNVRGLYQVVKDDIGDNWITLFGNMFKLNRNCVEATSVPDLDQLVHSMKRIKIEETRMTKMHKSPLLIINKDTLPCVEPGNLQTHFQIGSPEGKFKNCFLLKHIHLVRGERIVTYYFRDLLASRYHVCSRPDPNLRDYLLPSDFPRDLCISLQHIAAIERKDDGFIPVIVWGDFQKSLTIMWNEETESETFRFFP